MKTHQLDNWWETQERVAEVVSTDKIEDVGPRTRCHCQVSLTLYSTMRMSFGGVLGSFYILLIKV